MVRLISLILLLATWWLISQFVEPQTLPGPDRVLGAIAAQMRSGDMFFQLGVTLARVLAAFTIAMAAGTAIGLLMGRVKLADRLGDPWLIVLLNLPALVIIVLAFIWGGLTEIAGVLAVAINKLPNTVVTVREGARALDSGLNEMATVFALSWRKYMCHVVLPQLGPFLAAAGRSGLSLVWKIVLIVELLGRPNGIGFQIGVAFQLFDVTLILAYALAFVAV
ncbi:MAG: ABC transporter permease subunit, partial [Pseudolabrys sp.]